MLKLEACDRAAAEAGLGQKQQVHRVVRHVNYMLRGLMYGAYLVLASVVTLASPWLLVPVVIVFAGTEAAIWFIPPSKGVAALVRYEGGLGCVVAGGRFELLPWGVIDRCVYQPGRSERRQGSTRIYYAQVQLYLRGQARPVVVMHLRKAKQLALATSDALVPFQLRLLHQQLAQNGRVDLGGKLVVTPEGLIIGTSLRHKSNPLPWGRLTRVVTSPPSTLVLRAAMHLDPDTDTGEARVHIDGSATIAGKFIAELWNAARGADPVGGEPAQG